MEQPSEREIVIVSRELSKGGDRVKNLNQIKSSSETLEFSLTMKLESSLSTDIQTMSVIPFGSELHSKKKKGRSLKLEGDRMSQLAVPVVR